MSAGYLIFCITMDERRKVRKQVANMSIPEAPAAAAQASPAATQRNRVTRREAWQMRRKNSLNHQIQLLVCRMRGVDVVAEQNTHIIRVI